MKNQIANGNTLSYTATAVITSGDLVIVGKFVGVAVGTYAIGDEVVLNLNGVYEITKDATVAFVLGDRLFWDTVAKKLVKAPNANTIYVGSAFRAALAADTVGQLLLVGQKQAGGVADLGQTIGGAYSQTEVQAISDKVDELLGVLR